MDSQAREVFRDRAAKHAELAGLSAWCVVAGIMLAVHATTPATVFHLLQGISGLHWAANLMVGVAWTIGGALALVGMLRPFEYISTSWAIERAGWVNITCASGAYATGTLIMEPAAALSWTMGLALVFISIVRLGYLTKRERMVRAHREVERAAKRVMMEAHV